MRVTQLPDGDGVRLELSGELDIATTGEVDRHVRRALAARPASLTLDLSGLHFCDSTGAEALLAARAATTARRARFRLVNATGVTAKVLTLIGFPATER